MFTAYKKFWTHYADFEGKSTRSDYWWSVLCNVLITLPFGIMAFGSILVYLFICRSYTFDVGSNFKYFSCRCYVTMFYRSNCPTLYAN